MEYLFFDIKFFVKVRFRRIGCLYFFFWEEFAWVGLWIVRRDGLGAKGEDDAGSLGVIEFSSAPCFAAQDVFFWDDGVVGFSSPLVVLGDEDIADLRLDQFYTMWTTKTRKSSYNARKAIIFLLRSCMGKRAFKRVHKIFCHFLPGFDAFLKHFLLCACLADLLLFLVEQFVSLFDAFVKRFEELKFLVDSGL